MKVFSLSKYLKQVKESDNLELTDTCFEEDGIIETHMEKHGKLNDIVYSIKKTK